MEIETRYVNLKDYNRKSFRFWNKGSWTKTSNWLKNSKTYTVKVGSYLINSPKNSKTIIVNTIQPNEKMTKTVHCNNGDLGTVPRRDEHSTIKDPIQKENAWMSPKKKF